MKFREFITQPPDRCRSSCLLEPDAGNTHSELLTVDLRLLYMVEQALHYGTCRSQFFFLFLSFFLSFFLLDHQETLAALTVTFNVMQRNRLFLSCKQKDNKMILTQSGRNDPKVKRHAPGKKEKQLTFHFYVCESKCTVTHTLAQGQLRDCTGDRIIFFFPNCFASQIFI